MHSNCKMIKIFKIKHSPIFKKWFNEAKILTSIKDIYDNLKYSKTLQHIIQWHIILNP